MPSPVGQKQYVAPGNRFWQLYKSPLQISAVHRQGADLLKHGRHGKPKVHYFRLDQNDSRLTWTSAKNKIRSVNLHSVKEVRQPFQSLIVFGADSNSLLRWCRPGQAHLQGQL